MLVNTSWDSTGTHHIYMISSSPCVSNSCYNHTKISLKLLGLGWTSTLQLLLWWQELFLPQDAEEAEPDLIRIISCSSYLWFPLLWSPQTTSHLCLAKPVLLQVLVVKFCPKGREDAATIGGRNVGKVHCPRRWPTPEQTYLLCCRFRFHCEWFMWVWAWVIHHHWIQKLKTYHNLVRSNASFKVAASSKLNKAENKWWNPYIKCCLNWYFVYFHSP